MTSASAKPHVPVRMDQARLKQAIETRDIGELAKLLDIMRFRFRWNYLLCFRAATDATGIELADWDALLIEVDLRESL